MLRLFLQILYVWVGWGQAVCVFVCVEGVAVMMKKRGPTLLEVVTLLCVSSIHLWIKAMCVRVSVGIFVFLLRNRADFRAPGIKQQRSSSSLHYSPYLQHRWGGGGGWRVSSIAAINSLETSPVIDVKEP